MDETAPEWAITRRCQLSPTLAVEITVGPGGMICEWDPMPPTLTPTQVKKYRKFRDEMIGEFSRRSGQTVAVIET